MRGSESFADMNFSLHRSQGERTNFASKWYGERNRAHSKKRKFQTERQRIFSGLWHKYYSDNILGVNRFVDFPYEKPRKISLRCSWWSNNIRETRRFCGGTSGTRTPVPAFFFIFGKAFIISALFPPYFAGAAADRISPSQTYFPES